MMGASGFFGSKKGSVSDADAQAFLTYYSINDTTISNAINDLVIGLKADGLWTKMIAVYPMVGGTNSTVIGNLKTPGTYDLVLHGSPTVNANGITVNGTSQYTDTGIVPSLLGGLLGLNDSAMGLYSRTAGAYAKVDMGVKDTVTRISDLEIMWSDNKFYYAISSAGATEPGQTVGDGTGFYQASRQSSTTLQGMRNTTYYTGAVVSTGLPTASIWVGGRNSDYNGAPRNLALAYISSGLSQTEMTNFNSRNTTFQTALSR